MAADDDVGGRPRTEQGTESRLPPCRPSITWFLSPVPPMHLPVQKTASLGPSWIVFLICATIFAAWAAWANAFPEGGLRTTSSSFHSVAMGAASVLPMRSVAQKTRGPEICRSCQTMRIFSLHSRWLYIAFGLAQNGEDPH